MEILISTFVTLFVVVDPVGIAAIFTALVRNSETEYQRRMAIRGTAIASTIIFTFFLVGDKLLTMLGVGIPAFRIAGGLLLFLLAIDMVFARQTGLRSTTVKEQEEAQHKNDISVFPLAFPLIAGPGALTTVLLISTSTEPDIMFVWMGAIISLVLLFTLLSLLFAPKITRFLGETGANVVSRILGLVLAALAVQYVIDGIKTGLLD